MTLKPSLAILILVLLATIAFVPHVLYWDSQTFGNIPPRNDAEISSLWALKTTPRETNESQNKFPRKLHFLWPNKDFDFGEDDPHGVAKSETMARIQTIRNANPDWQVTVWTDEDCHALMKEHFSDMYSSWIGLQPQLKMWDAVRPAILYIHGGIYLDHDIQCDEDVHFSDWIGSQTTLLVRRPTEWNKKLGNHFMGSSPNHKFWLLYMENIFDTGKHTNVDRHTGPQQMYPTYQRYMMGLSEEERIKTRFLELNEVDKKGECEAATVWDSYCSMPRCSHLYSISPAELKGEDDNPEKQIRRFRNHMKEVSQVLYESATNFSELWPFARRHLCPKQEPNLGIIRALTKLAWKQLRGQSSTHAEEELQLLSGQDFRWEPAFSERVWKGVGSGYGFAYFLPKETDKQPLIYCRIYKCGNNEIRFSLLNHFFRRQGILRLSEHNLPATIRGKTYSHPPCLVTAIRDPIERFLSGYNEIEFRLDKVNDRMVSNSSSYFKSSTDPRQRFIMFLENLFGSHSLFAAEKKFVRHIFPLTRVLVGLNRMNLELTDYLPTLSNLTEAWPKFVRNACPGVDMDSETSTFNDSELVADVGFGKKDEGLLMTRDHPSSTDPLGAYAAAKEVWQEGGAIAEALCIWHVMDYACWPKLDDHIPPLCQSVYEQVLPELLRQELSKQ